MRSVYNDRPGQRSHVSLLPYDQRSRRETHRPPLTEWGHSLLVSELPAEAVREDPTDHFLSLDA